MNIMVFDVPAERGGALAILNDFYNEVVGSNDKNINWFFILSTPQLEETDNIKVLNFPWIKKSWGHRFYFDNFIAPNLVRKYRIDRILSFQNVIIPHIKCNQILYVHQSLPFVEHKFSIKENKLFWVYQNIIGRKIIDSIKKTDHIIVQTQWMKQACIDKGQVQDNKIEVIPPTINAKIEKYFEPNSKSLSTFFYPANESVYKNHKVIVEACAILKSLTDLKYEVIFTLRGDENQHIADLYRQVETQQLPIYFVGQKTREEVFEAYANSILLFPSYIETFGMPMLEARKCKGVIIAADEPFAREVLAGYKNAKFFDTFNSKELSVLMCNYLQGQEEYHNSCEIEYRGDKPKKIISTVTNSC
ncbi:MULTISPECIES: glycosyltransferase [Bacillus]|uniref:glycosyltransferase n=1 Tax=Bacillus TaxID=1386 RepID=UPI000A374AD2|nr:MULTISPECIES: glycosyltransferase [Bacillus]QGV06199.1 glycosyltransferase [Bacillus cereus]AXR19911.1 glycosyltransferase [Bacillus sp. CR71]AXR25643.1 glycosyltransferase [Bacillus sp. E25]OUB79617.1 glycosyl transferase family 1 [Bacillus thuringiensis serovar zhaodongensis]PGO47773.1 glycosyl transferase family 1 [Bacillus thuringiensis]